MKHFLLYLFAAAVSVPAQDLAVVALDSTPTQIRIDYTASSAAGCTISATDNNGGPSVHDLDPTLFTGANSDLARATANGFRWPTLVNGLNRTVFIGGHDEIKQGLDGKWYSTALQVNTDHTITVTCAENSGTIHASTSNLPLGSSYPELPIPTPGSPLGGMPQPTIDWANQTQQYIEPTTGVRYERLTNQNDNYTTTYARSSLIGPVMDVNGAWTNPGNFILSGQVASTSTPNAPIFAAVGTSTSEYFSDWLINPYGSTSSAGLHSAWCISKDSGQTCATNTPINVAMARSNQSYSTIPSTKPSSMFVGWGQFKASEAFGTQDLSNYCIYSSGCQMGGSVSGSGSTITIDGGPTLNTWFNMDRVVGSKFVISNCAGGVAPTNPLTVSEVFDAGTITTRESGLTFTGCKYQDLSVGIRAWLVEAGTLNVSFQIPDMISTIVYGQPANGDYYACAPQKVTDITTDCDGKPQSPALSGYLCDFGGRHYLLQDNGRSCLQSDGWNTTGVDGGAHMAATYEYLNSTTFVAKDFQIPYHFWRVQHKPNVYTAFQADYGNAAAHTTPDNYTYTDLGVSTINSQLRAARGPVSDALKTGFWPDLDLETVITSTDGSPWFVYRIQPAGDGGLTLMAFADVATNTLQGQWADWGGYPFTSGASHFSSQGGAGYVKVSQICGNCGGIMGPWRTNTSIPLGGPFTSKIAALHQQGSTWTTWNISVTSATAGSPITLTSANHDISNVATLPVMTTCSGGTGSWAVINGTWYVKVAYPNNNDFTLYTDPQGNTPLSGGSGSLTGTVTCAFASPIYSIPVTGVSSGNRIALNLSDAGYVRLVPSGKSLVRDGDPVTISDQYLDGTTQYWAKVTGVPAGYVDVYLDASLSAPANLSSLPGNYLAYAEKCPDPATLSLPGPMYMDLGLGSTGSEKVRCIRTRLLTEPESDFPYTREHTAYPPCQSAGVPAGCAGASAEAANTAKSMLHAINVGDGWQKADSFGNAQWESFYTLAVDRSAGENQIDVTLARLYGADPAYWGIHDASNTYGYQGPPGWSLWQTSTVPMGMVSMTSPTTYSIGPVNLVHGDIVVGSSAGLITQVSGYQPDIPDDLVDVTPSEYAAPALSTHDSFPAWNTGGVTAYNSSLNQSYPSYRVLASQAAAMDRSWKTDWMSMNGPIGYGQNNESGNNWTRILLNIRGTTYDLSSTTTHVYKIPPIGPINSKLAPVLVLSGPHGYYVDKSGPGSLLTDADKGKFCVAYQAGECRPNSSQWDVFFSATGIFNITSGTGSKMCLENDATLGPPCAFGVWPGGGWAVQVRISPVDTNATGFRRLTLAGWLPSLHYEFSHWVTSPDGKWGFFANAPFQQRPREKEYTGTHWFAMKLPPWPAQDKIDRTMYVPVPVRVPGHAGDLVRVLFGYGENGDPALGFCTTRQEGCWTANAATASNPFLFASEQPSKTPCHRGCTIKIPGIPERMLFYQVETTTANGQTVLGPLESIAVP